MLWLLLDFDDSAADSIQSMLGALIILRKDLGVTARRVARMVAGIAMGEGEG